MCWISIPLVTNKSNNVHFPSKITLVCPHAVLIGTKYVFRYHTLFRVGVIPKTLTTDIALRHSNLYIGS